MLEATLSQFTLKSSEFCCWFSRKVELHRNCPLVFCQVFVRFFHPLLADSLFYTNECHGLRKALGRASGDLHQLLNSREKDKEMFLKPMDVEDFKSLRHATIEDWKQQTCPVLTLLSDDALAESNKILAKCNDVPGQSETPSLPLPCASTKTQTKHPPSNRVPVLRLWILFRLHIRQVELLPGLVRY